jgi:hypothetical protein
MLAFVAALVVPLVFAQPAAQSDPRSQAKDVLKPYLSKLYRDNKSAKEVLESLKVLEALADEVHGDMWGRVERMMTYADPAVRLQVPKTLAAIGVGRDGDAQRRAKFLASGFKAKDPEWAAAYIEALIHLGPYHVKPHIPDYVEASKHDDVRVRRAASVLFHKWELDEQVLTMAISSLEDEDLGPDGKSGLGSVSWNGMSYLYRYKTASKGAAPGLIKIFKSNTGDDSYNYRALTTLAAVAPEERISINKAREWLKKKDSEKHIRKAMGVLSNLGPHAKEAIPDLIALAKREPFPDPIVEQGIKLGIVRTFGTMGPAAKDALATLGEIAATNDPIVRAAVREATKLILRDK